jgi:cytochrome c-type biogenesis protein CcmH
MRGWLGPIAIGLLLGLVALGVVLAVRTGAPPTAEERTDALSRELRCPDCQGLSVADSPTNSARAIRRQVAELVAAGTPDDEVRAHFVARYGQWILLAPTSPAAWLIPLIVVLAATIGLAAWILRRPSSVTPTPALSEDERRRLHDEAEALDA